jgi:hypothetical protein
LKNDLAIITPSGNVSVSKKKMVTFVAGDEDHPTLARSFTEDSYDDWDKQAIEYHEQYSKNNSTPYGYGYSDLNYYGAYNNVPGYGSLWQPYFTGAGWDPFMDGAWSWYPGFGFMFASAYPWGWMPFYYGSWVYAPGFGWGWQPGGWGSWSGVPRFTGAPPVHFHVPVVPAGAVRTVVVGRGGPVFTNGLPTHVDLNGGSAGLGIARGSVDGLKHLNSQVAKTGFVEVHAAPQFSASGSHGFSFGSVHGTGSSASSSGLGAGAAHVSSGSAGHASAGGAAHR